MGGSSGPDNGVAHKIIIFIALSSRQQNHNQINAAFVNPFEANLDLLRDLI